MSQCGNAATCDVNAKRARLKLSTAKWSLISIAYFLRFYTSRNGASERWIRSNLNEGAAHVHPFPSLLPTLPPAAPITLIGPRWRQEVTSGGSRTTKNTIGDAAYKKKKPNTHLVETWCMSASLAIHFSIALHVGFVRGFVLLTPLLAPLVSRCVTRRIKYRRRTTRKAVAAAAATWASGTLSLRRYRSSLPPEGEWVLLRRVKDGRAGRRLFFVQLSLWGCEDISGSR